MRGRQQGVQGCGGDANRVQDSHVRKDATRAECVDGRGRYAEQLGDFADGEQTIAATWEPRGREQNRSKIESVASGCEALETPSRKPE